VDSGDERKWIVDSGWRIADGYGGALKKKKDSLPVQKAGF
jgi:hypothetical protein